MKINILIFFSLVGANYAAITNPAQFLATTNDYQQRTTALQQEIIDVIAGLRLSITRVLKGTSNTTLDQIYDNADTILEMDDPIREEIFVKFNRTTSCMMNLRARLNSVTEFTGFHSRNCLRRYDEAVTKVVNVGYEALAEYESALDVIQTIVTSAFTGKNIWRESAAIQNNYITAYNTHKAEWDQIAPIIANFLQTFEADIRNYNDVLHECFLGVHERYAPDYASVLNGLEICNEYDF
jgi:hypothetical protein